MSGFLSKRLDSEKHGSSAITTSSRIISLLSGIGLVGVAVYLGFTASFGGRFLPGVAVGGRNLAGLTRSQARSQLKADIASYRLHLDIAGTPRQVALEQVGARYDINSTLMVAYNLGRNDDAILPSLLYRHLSPLTFAYNLDRTKLASYAKGISDELGVAPKNATIVISSGTPQVQPDQNGWGINDRALRKVLVDSLASASTESISVRAHIIPAAVSSTATQPAVAQTKQILATPLILSYGEKQFSPGAKLVGSWIVYELNSSGDGLTPKLDEGQVKNYINQIANQVNIAPVNRKINIENGVSTEKQAGVDGMAIDQDAAVAAVVAALTRRTPLAYTITSKPVPFKTESVNHISLDYGRYIEVNLSLQHLWVYQDHEVIYDSPITSGATGAGLGTATGLFSIYYKTTNTHLRGYQYGYDYDVFVKYWMPFYQGYGLHDASWRNGKFGGQDYYYGGSHGCVNLPEATAAFIYSWAEVGTPVWVHK